MLNCDSLRPTHERPPCREADMERRQYRCRKLFDACFPYDGSHGTELHDVFMHEFCDQVGPFSAPPLLPGVPPFLT